jgi:dTDP-4-amino-4,6-dideoxygalactose transaminase
MKQSQENLRAKLFTKHQQVIAMAKPIIEEDEIEAVIAVLKSGILAQGKKVEEFEEAFTEFSGTRYAVAVNSGTNK